MPITPTEGVSAMSEALAAASRSFAAAGRTRNADTARSMAQALQRWQSFASEAQYRFAQRLVQWAAELRTSGPRPETVLEAMTAPLATDSPRQRVAHVAIERIHALFRAAREHSIQHPRITLRGLRLSMSRDGRERVFVTRAAPTSQGRTYYGAILPDGTFNASREITEEVEQTLREFGTDPLAIARAHGLATGSCCFCNRRLTDARSVAMGYGPICAEHFGLEWGAQRASSVVELDPEAVMNRIVAEGDRAEAESVARRELVRDRQLTMRERIAASRQQRAPRPVGSVQDEDEHFM